MNTKIKFKEKRSWVEIEMNIMLEYFEKQSKKYVILHKKLFSRYKYRNTCIFRSFPFD